MKKNLKNGLFTDIGLIGLDWIELVHTGRAHLFNWTF